MIYLQYKINGGINMGNWNNVLTTPPPDGKEVLAYTENNKMGVFVYFNGRWNTYLKVTHWMEKPEGPEKDITTVSKKRGRPKK